MRNCWNRLVVVAVITVVSLLTATAMGAGAVYVEDFDTDPSWTYNGLWMPGNIGWDDSDPNFGGVIKGTYYRQDDGTYGISSLHTALPVDVNYLNDANDWGFTVDVYPEEGYKARCKYQLADSESSPNEYIGFYIYPYSGAKCDFVAYWKVDGNSQLMWNNDAANPLHEWTVGLPTDKWYTVSVSWNATERRVYFKVYDKATGVRVGLAVSGEWGAEYTGFSFGYFDTRDWYDSGNDKSYSTVAYMDNLLVYNEPICGAIEGQDGMFAYDSGTTKFGKLGYLIYLDADLNRDCIVDFEDFAEFASQWLQ